MQTINEALGLMLGELSDENYADTLAFYRSWCEAGGAYLEIPFDQIVDAIWNHRGSGSSIVPSHGRIFHATAHLILRFAKDAQLSHTLAPYSSELQERFCARTLRDFASDNLMIAQYKRDLCTATNFCADANLIAHWANLGFVGETVIRNHILQSLIYHPKLYNHQVFALIILFTLAGATFEAYADPSVVDCCFELLKIHSAAYPTCYNGYSSSYVERMKAIQGAIQEVIALRERGWEGLPPPPVFTTGKPKQVGANQRDPAATPVATSLGLPNRDPEPQFSQPPSVPEPATIFEPPVTPLIPSPSISISSLSDFTIADATDDEPPVDSLNPDTSDDDRPVDPTVVVPHKTFYLEDGNVEVLCGSTLFRVHTSILSFHSPALRRMFAQASLATAESPNGCPRITSSDTATDFTTLLKMIYFPGFPERGKVPDFTTFSSLLRITTKYEMPAIRSQILEVVRDAYPETFEGLNPSKSLGENVFNGRSPHPNEVLDLFIRQKITSALPMAYYMATRSGPNSLMDARLPRNATLPPEILRRAITGFVGLREVELNGTHDLIFEQSVSHPCLTSNCPSRTPTSPAAFAAYHKVFNRIVGSFQMGTKVLQVPEFYEDRDGELQCVGHGICSTCVERWESGHAELRKKAWATLPDVFGLKG